MQVYGSLERAQLETASDYAAALTGAIWWNSSEGKVKTSDGTLVRALLRNDAKCILGNSGTANDNIRLHRGAAGVLQLVVGSDATAEGSLSTALNQLSARVENYATGSLPAAANAGRLLWDTTLSLLKVDTGAAIKQILSADGTQVVTNKDIDGGVAANTRRITLPGDTKTNLDALTRKAGTIVYASDTQKAYLDNGSLLKAIGTGSGTGVNFITNGDAEVDAAGWATYADAAGSKPVNGTGGSPTVTWTRSTSSPLEGDGSFLLTKDAANRQGEGASYDFVVPAAHRGKVCTLKLDYQILSGTYVPGDVIAYLYRVDATARLIEPVPFSLAGGVVGVPYSHAAVFQADTDAVNYRVIFHVATVSALAYVLKIDNVQIGPQVLNVSPVLEDWKLDTTMIVPNAAGFGTITNRDIRVRRVGDTLHVRGTFRAGTTAASLAYLELVGIKIDTAKLTSEAQVQALGVANQIVTGGSYKIYSDSSASLAVFYDAVEDRVYIGPTTASNVIEKHFVNAFMGTGAGLTFEFSIPVKGWGSSSVSVSGGEGRVVSMRVRDGAPTTSAYDATVALKFTTTPEHDTHGAFSNSTGQFTCPVAGYYRAVLGIAISGNFTAGQVASAYLVKNGTTVQYSVSELEANHNGNIYPSVISVTIKCNAGDTIEPRVLANGSGLGITSDANSNFFEVTRVSGPETIQAGETVAVKYGLSAPTAVGGGATIPFDMKIEDTHGAMAAGVFTAPVAGLYQVTGTLSITTGSNDGTFIQKNGANDEYWGFVHATLQAGTFNGLIRLKAGDTFDVHTGGALTYTDVSGGKLASHINIVKVGN